MATAPRKEKTSREWALERKEVAKRQLGRIPGLTTALFERDNLDSFLALLSRVPYYNYLNLLIIHDKFPGASVLAGFSVWQRMLESEGSNIKVLTAKAIGNGIDLLIPFTNMISDRDYELIWYSLPVFDVRQTNVKSFTPRPPVYILDHMHQMLLREAVTAVLGNCYHHRVVFDPQTVSLRSCGLCGRISEQTVSVCKDADDDEALSWLTEALCDLAIGGPPLSPSSRNLLQQYIHCCLYKMWSLAHPGVLPGSHKAIPSEERPLFLDLLQRTVFQLHQAISGFYLSQRREDQQLEDDLVLPPM